MQEQRRTRFPIIATIGLTLLAIGLWRSVTDLRARKGILGTRKTELARLEAERKTLTAKLAEANTPEFVEREARERLGLVREGETVLLMEQGKGEAVRPGPEIQQEQPLWKQWLDVFF